MMMDGVRPGIHGSAQAIIDDSFSAKEKRILRRWAELWYITSAGKRTLGTNSEYKYALVKPTSTIEEALNISRELVIIFSPYESFEARTLQAYENIVTEFADQRYEKLCYALISADDAIEENIKRYLSNEDDQVVIPFSYNSFDANKGDPHFIRNQFRKYFYSRDLFDYSEPLKKETFFFGRTDIVMQIINKHKAGMNCGLFGLRKTGKTSIIYEIHRKARVHDFVSVSIDCQNTSFNMRRWNNALYYVVNVIKNTIDFPDPVFEEDFTLENASDKFCFYLEQFKIFSHKKILIMFDEIENITFGKASSEHWCSGLDFVYFWQSIRSCFQNTGDVFTFCILGTNPKCIEDATILDKDNPIFNMFQPVYIPGFDHTQTREMVRKLGRIMGISFDEGIYTRLVEDYGGHPFLIRRMCSKIAQMNPERPVIIDRKKYAEAKREFNLENSYFTMILEVLAQFYVDEYEMLKFLALGDTETFKFYINEDPSMINHLLGYGLVRRNDQTYDFKLDAIKDYLERMSSKHPILETNSEKWAHICTRRNDLELRLRRMVKTVIRIAHKNEADAKSYVIKKIFADDRKYSTKAYAELFDSRSSNIYLKNLFTLIKADWEYFGDYFGKQDIFNVHMAVLNTEGRFDAHATVPDDAEIAAVDAAVSYLQKALEQFEAA